MEIVDAPPSEITLFIRLKCGTRDCMLIIQVQLFMPVTQQWQKQHFDILLGAEVSLICPVTV